MRPARLTKGHGLAMAIGITLLSTPSAMVHADTAVYKLQRTKPPIYDEPEKARVVHDDPSTLELVIRDSRHKVTNAFAGTRERVRTVTDEWIAYENKLKTIVAGYAGPDDRVLPGALYVTIGFFAGSILARNRSIMGRTLFPAALAAGTFIYYYPTMSRNLGNRVIRAQQNSSLPIKWQRDTGNAPLTIKSMWHTVQQQFGLAKEESAEVVHKIESMYTTRDKPGVEDTTTDLKPKRDGVGKPPDATVIHEEGRPKAS
ncbi:hypothetical protein SeLEV6574_g01815 [Synchytrium endobioticum]|nr:hypothetical protein SeLEV6574_g01815 [Synchytrium endobioticum]